MNITNERKKIAYLQAITRIEKSRKSDVIMLPGYVKNLDVPPETYCPVCGKEIKKGEYWKVYGYIHFWCDQKTFISKDGSIKLLNPTLIEKIKQFFFIRSVNKLKKQHEKRK